MTVTCVRAVEGIETSGWAGPQAAVRVNPALKTPAIVARIGMARRLERCGRWAADTADLIPGSTAGRRIPSVCHIHVVCQVRNRSMAQTRPLSRPARKAETREAILDAATRLFIRRGIAATS